MPHYNTLLRVQHTVYSVSNLILIAYDFHKMNICNKFFSIEIPDFKEHNAIKQIYVSLLYSKKFRKKSFYIIRKKTGMSDRKWH